LLFGESWPVLGDWNGLFEPLFGDCWPLLGDWNGLLLGDCDPFCGCEGYCGLCDVG
jgi:hypothetical protein